VLVLGVALSAAASFAVRLREGETERLAFERRASELAAALALGFDVPLEVLRGIPALFEASSDVTRGEFQRFVRGALARHRSIYALEWIPRVSRAERAAYEARARDEGIPGFQFSEDAGLGRMVRAAERPEHLPILYMEPPHPSALGFDVASEAARRAPLDRARDTGETVASGRIRLVEDLPTVYSVAVFHPVYAGGTSPATLEARRAAFVGAAVVVFRVRPLVERLTLRGDWSGLGFVLLDDPAAPSGERLLYETSPSGGGASAPLRAQRKLVFGDRRWHLEVLGARQGAAAGHWTLLSGISLSCLLALVAAAASTILRLRRQVRAARELGQYTLVAELGRGGMGVVYEARHAMLRRRTAIKLLPAGRHDEHDLSRFEREARLTSQLTHPNTIQVYDYGRTPDGVFYFAMEYLDGLTFQELVDADGAQPAPRVVHLLKQALGALAEAHSVGLVHRDVKPANLMLCVRGGIADFVKVLDFGLVKRVATHDPSLSALNAVVGTPQYLAPEAITDPGFVGPATDLYALGAVAYFLLAGRPVFQGANVVEIATQHLYAVPPPMSAHAGVEVPRALEALVMRCLEKRPEARPVSAAELLDELARCAVGAWPARKAEQWWTERGRALLHGARARRRRGVSRAYGTIERTIAADAFDGEIPEISTAPSSGSTSGELLGPAPADVGLGPH
jgi:CHASE1-domain containing sensor protein